MGGLDGAEELRLLTGCCWITSEEDFVLVDVVVTSLFLWPPGSSHLHPAAVALW